MGREVRKVRPDWVHPKDEEHVRYRPMHDGTYQRYKPMHEGSYQEAAEDWLGELAEFEPTKDLQYYWEYAGPPPEADCYMYNEKPDPKELTHFQMYENTSEGTPISPVFDNVEALARWLADNGASAFGSMKATYDQWLATCKAGCSMGSLVITGDGRQLSGVAMADAEK